MERLLPQNIRVEQIVLGCLLIEPEAMDIIRDMGLEADDFFEMSNRTIFQVIQEIYNNGNNATLTLVESRLKEKKQLTNVGGREYILELLELATTTAELDHYVKIIMEKSDARKLIKVAEEIKNEGLNEELDIDEVMQVAEKKVLEITRERKGVSKFRSAKNVLDSVMASIEAARNNDGQLTGLRTQFSELDELTNGLQKGDLIILAARPSVGKTAFALNLALNVATPECNDAATVAIFSLEMPAEQLMQRILSAFSEVEGAKLRSGELSDFENDHLFEKANILSNYNLFIDDTSGVKMNEIFSKCRKLKSSNGLDLIIIDYLQLISSAGNRSGDRQQEVSEISRSLKQLAREMEVPVIALSQLSRSIEQRQDKTPQLSDLRESGSIEQDADIVMFLSRDDYQKSNEQELEEVENQNIVNLSVKKHRNGGLKDIELTFKKEINYFADAPKFADAHQEFLSKGNNF